MPTLLIPSVFSPKWDPFLWHQESQRDGRFVSMLGIVVVPFPTSASTAQQRQDSTTWHALLKTHYTTESWSSLLKLSSVRHSTMDFVVHPEKESQSARDEEKKRRPSVLSLYYSHHWLLVNKPHSGRIYHKIWPFLTYLQRVIFEVFSA